MIILPYNTDAPIYHWPFATVALIVVNTVLFFTIPSSWVMPASMSDEIIASTIYESSGEEPDVIKEAQYVLCLEYGAGIKPWQWLTSNFMHANFLHLLFNMVVLWAFGLVIEGKVGPLIFLAIYLGIGVSESAIEQIVMSLAVGEGSSLGASAAILGLLGIAIVWAPRNEFDMFVWCGRIFIFEMPILYFGFLEFATEIFNVVMSLFQATSAILHMMGFAIGLGFGFVWLLTGMVDCEGWDLITVLKGHEGRDFEKERLEKEAQELVDSTHRPSTEIAARITAPVAGIASTTEPKVNAFFAPPASPSPSADDFADLYSRPVAHSQTSPQIQLRQCIEAGESNKALQWLAKLRKDAVFELAQPLLAKLIRDLLAAQDYSNAIPLMAEHIRRFADNRLALQINLSRILIQKDKPQKALQVLKSIQTHNLDAKSEQTIQALIGHALHLIKP
jgi:membrane associated rhomboid family serine protease